MNDRERVLHIVPAAYFEALPADQPYLPSQFESDGFVHCTREAEVLLAVANAIYRAVPGRFLTLVIDPARLTAPLRYEPPSPPPADPSAPLAGHLFPHIYGAVDREAIVEVRPVRRAPDGAFLSI